MIPALILTTVAVLALFWTYWLARSERAAARAGRGSGVEPAEAVTASVPRNVAAGPGADGVPSVEPPVVTATSVEHATARAATAASGPSSLASRSVPAPVMGEPAKSSTGAESPPGGVDAEPRRDPGPTAAAEAPFTSHVTSPTPGEPPAEPTATATPRVQIAAGGPPPAAPLKAATRAPEMPGARARAAVEEAALDAETFWTLIALIDARRLRTADFEAVAPLTRALARRTRRDIRGFAMRLERLLDALDTEDHRRSAGRNATDDDAFRDARCAVIARGRVFYERVLTDPRHVPKARRQGCGALLDAAPQAWMAQTGEPWEARTGAERPGRG